jgi:hypothetical protein
MKTTMRQPAFRWPDGSDPREICDAISNLEGTLRVLRRKKDGKFFGAVEHALEELRCAYFPGLDPERLENYDAKAAF